MTAAPRYKKVRNNHLARRHQRSKTTPTDIMLRRCVVHDYLDTARVLLNHVLGRSNADSDRAARASRL